MLARFLDLLFQLIRPHLRSRIVYGLVGKQGTGKGAATEYLVGKRDALRLRSSDLPYWIYDTFFGGPDANGSRDRKLLSRIFTVLHTIFLSQTWVVWLRVLEMATTDRTVIVFDSIRLHQQRVALEVWARRLGFEIVFLVTEADDETCYRRCTKRTGDGSKSDERNMSFEEWRDRRDGDANEKEVNHVASEYGGCFLHIANNGDDKEEFWGVLQDDLNRRLAELYRRTSTASEQRSQQIDPATSYAAAA